MSISADNISYQKSDVKFRFPADMKKTDTSVTSVTFIGVFNQK